MCAVRSIGVGLVDVRVRLVGMSSVNQRLFSRLENDLMSWIMCRSRVLTPYMHVNVNGARHLYQKWNPNCDSKLGARGSQRVGGVLTNWQWPCWTALSWSLYAWRSSFENSVDWSLLSWMKHFTALIEPRNWSDSFWYVPGWSKHHLWSHWRSKSDFSWYQCSTADRLSDYSMQSLLHYLLYCANSCLSCPCARVMAANIAADSKPQCYS